MGTQPELTIIGENIHATRVLRRSDPRVGVDELGREAIGFHDCAGVARWLPVSEAERESTSYQEGKIKHVRLAIQTASKGSGPDAEAALAYLEAMARSQVAAGARYLDLNVDEVSISTAEQVEAMRWLVRTVSSWTDVPVCVDSPSLEVLAAGVEEALSWGKAAPMVNSASLERLEALDLAREADGPVIVTATGESGMPTDAAQRVANAERLVELAAARGIPLGRIHVDPLVFPIAVDGAAGAHCLSAYRELRQRYGAEIHLTGGISNISFGLPCRRLLNEVFLLLAIEAGADSGILDPVASPLERVLALDREAEAVRLAIDAITGVDQGCRAYLKAYRAGRLQPGPVSARD